MKKIIEFLIVGGIILFAIGLLPIQLYTVVSGSMEPTIATGSIVIVNKQVEQYQVGDVVTFTVNQSPVTHRIVSTQQVDGETTYITKGDANNAEDPIQLHDSQIVGTVIFAVPYIGRMILFIREHLLSIVGVCGVIYLSTFFFQKHKQTNFSDKKTEELS